MEITGTKIIAITIALIAIMIDCLCMCSNNKGTMVSGRVIEKSIDEGLLKKHYYLTVDPNCDNLKIYKKEVTQHTFNKFDKGDYCAFEVDLDNIRK